MCCSVLQCVAVCVSTRAPALPPRRSMQIYVAVCCSVLQCVAVYYSCSIDPSARNTLTRTMQVCACMCVCVVYMHVRVHVRVHLHVHMSVGVLVIVGRGVCVYRAALVSIKIIGVLQCVAGYEEGGDARCWCVF